MDPSKSPQEPAPAPAPDTQTDPSERPQEPVGPSFLLKDAAETAAARIVEAEIKAQLAIEAVKEVEEIEKLVEKSEAMLQLTKEIHEKCSRGEDVHLDDK